MFFSNKCLFKGQVSLPSWLIGKNPPANAGDAV